MSAQSLSEKSRDELYEIAKSQSVEGRSKMTKDELLEELTRSTSEPNSVDFDSLVPAITRRGEFSDVLTVNEGDVVEVSHLSRSTPEVTEVTHEDNQVVVTMETSRGGRHRLIVPLDDQGEPQAKGAHLRRWRAGDAHWMMNSSTPYFLRVVE